MEREVLLSIENLTVRYGKEAALQIEAPILIEEGDRVGIIGSNGAGKSTLIRSILGPVNYQGNISTKLTLEQIATHMQFNEYTDAMATRHIMEAILQTRLAHNQKLQELVEYFELEDCLRKNTASCQAGRSATLYNYSGDDAGRAADFL